MILSLQSKYRPSKDTGCNECYNGWVPGRVYPCQSDSYSEDVEVPARYEGEDSYEEFKGHTGRSRIIHCPPEIHIHPRRGTH